MKKIILIIVITFIISFIAGNVFAAVIQIENKALTLTQYLTLKNKLIDDYKTKGFFTINEWKTYVAVLNWEARAGNLKLMQNTTKQNLISKIMDKIYVK